MRYRVRMFSIGAVLCTLECPLSGQASGRASGTAAPLGSHRLQEGAIRNPRPRRFEGACVAVRQTCDCVRMRVKITLFTH